MLLSVRSCLLVVIFALLSPASVRADSVLFSTFGPGQSFLPSGFLSTVVTSSRWAGASFQPGVTGTLSTVDLAVSIGGAFLTIDVARDASGAPGTILDSFSLTGQSGAPVVRTGISSLHPLLTAGNTYWLILRPGDDAGVWYANNQGVLGLDTSTDSGTTWNAYTVAGTANPLPTPAFAINGTAPVPEPSTAVLLLTVAGAVGICRRRTA